MGFHATLAEKSDPIHAVKVRAVLISRHRVSKELKSREKAA